MQEMLFQEKGINFNDYPSWFKRVVYLQPRTVARNLPPKPLVLIPEDKRPIGPVLRCEMVYLDLPPTTGVANRIEILFDGSDPQTT